MLIHGRGQPHQLIQSPQNQCSDSEESYDADSVFYFQKNFEAQKLIEQLFLGIDISNYFLDNKKIEFITNYIENLNRFLNYKYSVDSFFGIRLKNTIIVRWIFNFDNIDNTTWAPLTLLAKELDISINKIQEIQGYQFFYDKSGMGTVVLPFTPYPIVFQFVPFKLKVQKTINRQQVFIDYCLSLREIAPHQNEAVFLNSLELGKFKELVLRFEEKQQAFLLLHAYRIIYNSYNPNREIWLKAFDIDQLIKGYSQHSIIFSSPCLIGSDTNAAKYYLTLKELIEKDPQPEKILRDQEVQLILSGLVRPPVKLTGPGSLLDKIWNIDEFSWRKDLIIYLKRRDEGLIDEMIQNYNDFSEKGSYILIDFCNKINERWPDFCVDNRLAKRLFNIKCNNASLVISTSINKFIENKVGKLIRDINKATQKPEVIARKILKYHYLFPASIIFDHLLLIAKYLTDKEADEFLECLKRLYLDPDYDFSKIAAPIAMILSTKNPPIVKQLLMDFLVEKNCSADKFSSEESDQLVLAAMQLSLAKKEVVDVVFCKFIDQYFSKSGTPELFEAFTHFLLTNQSFLSFNNFCYLIEMFYTSCDWKVDNFVMLIEKIDLTLFKSSEELRLLKTFFTKIDGLCCSNPSGITNKTTDELSKLSQAISFFKINIIKSLCNEEIFFSDEFWELVLIIDHINTNQSFPSDLKNIAQSCLQQVKILTKNYIRERITLTKNIEDLKQGFDVLIFFEKIVDKGIFDYKDSLEIFFEIFSKIQKEDTRQAQEFAYAIRRAINTFCEDKYEQKMIFSLLIYRLLNDISILQSTIDEIQELDKNRKLFLTPNTIFWFLQIFSIYLHAIKTTVDKNEKIKLLDTGFYLLNLVFKNRATTYNSFNLEFKEIKKPKRIIDLSGGKVVYSRPNKASLRNKILELFDLLIESTPIFGFLFLKEDKQARMIELQTLFSAEVEVKETKEIFEFKWSEISKLHSTYAEKLEEIFYRLIIQSIKNRFDTKNHELILESWLPTSFKLYQDGLWEKNDFYNFFSRVLSISNPSFNLLSSLNYYLKKFAKIDDFILTAAAPASSVLIANLKNKFLSSFSKFSFFDQLDIFNQLTTGVICLADSDFDQLTDKIISSFIDDVKTLKITNTEQAEIFHELLLNLMRPEVSDRSKKRLSIAYGILKTLADKSACTFFNDKNLFLKLILKKVTSSFLKENNLFLLNFALQVLKDIPKDETAASCVFKLLLAYRHNFRNQIDQKVVDALLAYNPAIAPSTFASHNN